MADGSSQRALGARRGLMSRAAARNAVREQYKFFTATEEEAFSVFGRAEVKGINRIRQVTDVQCLVAFAIVCAVMVWLDTQASLVLVRACVCVCPKLRALCCYA